jgi:hypothetical protein
MGTSAGTILSGGDVDGNYYLQVLSGSFLIWYASHIEYIYVILTCYRELKSPWLWLL